MKSIVGQRLEEIDARGVNSIPLRATSPDGQPVVVRVGRYGPYLQAGGDDGARVSIADDIAPDELTSERVAELLNAPSGDRELGIDPETGQTVLVKAGRYGPYVTTVVPEDSKESPRTGSLFASMSPETVTLEEALRLLTLPRTVGTAPDGEEIQALNGRYGPYLKKGTDSRSIDAEEKLFSTTLEEALAIFAQPKQRGRAAAKPPLAELGVDPVSQGPVTVREGRFGPYVTDGESNASLRKGDDPLEHHPGACRRTAGRPARAGSGEEKGHQEGRRQEDHGQEDRGQEDHRQEDHHGEGDHGEGEGGEGDGEEDDHDRREEDRGPHHHRGQRGHPRRQLSRRSAGMVLRRAPVPVTPRRDRLSCGPRPARPGRHHPQAGSGRPQPAGRPPGRWPRTERCCARGLMRSPSCSVLAPCGHVRRPAARAAARAA